LLDKYVEYGIPNYEEPCIANSCSGREPIVSNVTSSNLHSGTGSGLTKKPETRTAVVEREG